MNQERIKKLESISAEIISQTIQEISRDFEEDFGLINISKVKISPDLSYADIYISSFKNESILAKTLAKHNHDIQQIYHKSIQIRKLPKIRYRYDKSGEIGQNICDTIKKL